MYHFDYARPETLDEASIMLQSDKDAVLLAGGQTLLPTLKQRLAHPSKLIDLARVSGLADISRQGEALVIGAMTTHAAIATDETVKSTIPALAQLSTQIGDPQVRHRGTIGGSLANNDPAADWPAAALALAATIETTHRNIAADDYFTGLFQNALEAGEIIKSISFPIAEKAGYAKFEQRASRFALVGVFVARTASGVRMAVTGAGDNGVFRAHDLEQNLTANYTAAALKDAIYPPDNLMSDLHASARYRAALIPVLAEQAIEAFR